MTMESTFVFTIIVSKKMSNFTFLIDESINWYHIKMYMKFF